MTMNPRLLRPWRQKIQVSRGAHFYVPMIGDVPLLKRRARNRRTFKTATLAMQYAQRVYARYVKLWDAAQRVKSG